MKIRCSVLFRAVILALCISTASVTAAFADEAVGSAPVSEITEAGSAALKAAEQAGFVPTLIINDSEEDLNTAASKAADTAKQEAASALNEAATVLNNAADALTATTAAETSAASETETTAVSADAPSRYSGEAKTAVKPADDNSTAQAPPTDTFSEYTVDAPLSDAEFEEDEKWAAEHNSSGGPGVNQVQAGNSGVSEPVVNNGDAAASAGLTTDWSQVSDLRKKVVEYAKTFVGGTYTYGGTSPDTGFDCSGLVLYVMKNAAGVELYHQSAVQATKGVGVSASEMRPGDIIAYDGRPRNGSVNHIGIYIGDGQMVHAVGTGKGIRISAWNFEEPITIRNVLGD